ncbi:MAG: ABC transporter substrate-binding protein [Acidisphaera sp.]|nr:ABC transporter substrate-binding protein [Acidisphaera sp.]
MQIFHPTRRSLLAGVGAVALAVPLARAQGKVVKIGVLNDQSGAYADYQGIGSVVGAQLAADDMGGKIGDMPVQVITADHQNSPDIGSAIARRWLDNEGVDAIADVPNSAIALAVNDLVRQRNKVLLGSGVGTSELTGAKCSPNTVHWTYDNWELGHALGSAVLARGGNKWFFLTADYAFGYDLESNTANAVKAGGGTVLGEVKHPLGTSDFSSYLLQAQSSGANVLALANAGADTTNSIKQANEFGLAQTMTIVGPIVNINVIAGTGLAAAQGVLAVTPFYWDFNDATRAFAARFAARHPRHIMPNDMQAGVYAAVLHYGKAVKAIGRADDGAAVVDEMKRLPTDDPLFGRGTIRPDGRKVHPVYLFQTKTPAESTGQWDMFKLVSTIPAAEAFRPLNEGHCPLVSG